MRKLRIVFISQLLSNFEESPNDANGAWKPIFTDYKLCQHRPRSGIRRRFQTVLLKIASPQLDPHHTQIRSGRQPLTHRQGHKFVQ
jgi:hypothetical protein